MIDKNMIKLAQIRNSYAMKQFGALSSGEKALLDYESLCLELMKENQQLKEENERLQEQKDFWRKEFVDKKEQLDLYKEVIEEVREYINNYDVFKEFSFPIMKRHEENQVKSSIKYEFDTSIKKDLLQILDKVKGEKPL